MPLKLVISLHCYLGHSIIFIAFSDYFKNICLHLTLIQVNYHYQYPMYNNDFN